MKHLIDICIVILLTVSALSAFAQTEESQVHAVSDTGKAPYFHRFASIVDSSRVSVLSQNISERPGVFDWITALPGDWAEWSKSAFRAENIPLITSLTLVTAGMVLTDYESWQFTKGWYDRSHIVREFSNRGVDIGDGKFQFGLAVGFLAGGLIFDDTKALRTASQITEVILACGGVVQFLKHTTGRESPFVATTPTGRWVPFPNQIEYHTNVPHYDAFPSGHIATALATMTVIAENYPEERWIRYVGYPAVGLVGFGLVATSIHWWSDIPLGIALGYSFGMLVSHKAPTAKESVKPPGITAYPDMYFSFLRGGTPALSFVWRL